MIFVTHVPEVVKLLNFRMCFLLIEIKYLTDNKLFTSET